MTAMDWTALETGLPSLMSTLMGIPCEFRDQPRTMQQGAHATLDVFAATAIGIDDRQWAEVTEWHLTTYGGDPILTQDGEHILLRGAAVQETTVGNRELTLQVSVWSPSQRLSKAARRYVERLRTRLRWDSSLSTLRGLGLALVRLEGLVDADAIQDGRMRSMATMDLRLAYIDVEHDDEIPFIETARIRGEATDAGGDPVGDSVEMDETVTL